jgi:hypothetical protein
MVIFWNLTIGQKSQQKKMAISETQELAAEMMVN